MNIDHRILTICLVGVVGGFSLGCKSPKPTAEGSTSSPSTAASPVVKSMNIDSKRAQRATVILRVERVVDHGGSKYHWVTVKPLRVLKNDAKANFSKPLRVAYRGGKPGVPVGVCTVYLEPYGDGASGHWLLLDGDGTAGVSHRATR